MIGRFGLGNKRSSSNESRNFDSQLMNKAARSPQQGLSHSTSSFFSLPIWKRRKPQSAQSTSPYPTDPEFDDLGLPPRRSSYNFRQRDEPLPSPSSDNVPYRRSVPWLSASVPGSNGGFQAGPSTQSDHGHIESSTTRRARKEDPSLRSSFVKARAAPDSKLSHDIHGQAPLSPSSETSSVPFVPNLPPSDQAQSSKSIVRKMRSFQRLTPDPPRNDASDFRDYRRQRGLSVGPIYSEPESKGKEKEGGLESNPITPQKMLSRKSSFWRRINDSLNATAPPLPNPSSDGGFIPRPSLPSLRPISPLDVRAATLPSISTEISTLASPPSVQRRHSERAHSLTGRVSSPTSPIDKSPTTPLTRRRNPQRPKTADSTHGHSSYHARSGPPSPLPPLSPVASPYPTSRSASLSRDKSITRPRAQTNPPIFHRLSMNLFLASTPFSPVSQLSPSHKMVSPAPSTFSSPRPSTSKNSVEIPRPLPDGESPVNYVSRLMDVVNKSDVASILANK
jgi:hypothetical protein